MIEVSKCEGQLGGIFAGHGPLCAVVCTIGTQQLQFKVSFPTSPHWENAVLIIRKSDREQMRLLNNFHGRGAGSQWQDGAGLYETPAPDEDCYWIVGRHKKGAPDRDKPWFPSPFTTHETGTLVAFEDGGDRSYTDATVKVSVVKP